MKHQRSSTWNAIALLVSGTVGAGVLGLPYAFTHVGVVGAVAYCVVFGIAFWGLHRVVAALLIRQAVSEQLVGVVAKSLGKMAAKLMMLITHALFLASAVIFIVGIGQILAQLAGGPALAWSGLFWAVAGLLVIRGIRTIKNIDFVLTVGLMVVLLVIIVRSAVPAATLAWPWWGNGPWWYPYGVVLFAFHGVMALPEAFAAVRRDPVKFKRALGWSSVIVTVGYTLFAVLVLAVTGAATTEIATLGLGERLGPFVAWCGNLFALLAMSISFLMNSVEWRDSLCWDNHWRVRWALAAVLGLPMLVVLLGMREFVTAIGAAGGVLVTAEILLLLAAAAVGLRQNFKLKNPRPQRPRR